MSKQTHDRAQELAYRRMRLQAQCAIQRRALGAAAADVEYQLMGVDKAVLMVRRVTSAPALVSAAVAALTLVGPKRALKWVSQGAFWYTTGKQMLGLVNSQPGLKQTLHTVLAAIQSRGTPAGVRSAQRIDSQTALESPPSIAAPQR